MVVGLTGFEVGRHGFESDGRAAKRLVVERVEHVGNLVKGELAAVGVSRADEALHRQIAVVGGVLHVDQARPAGSTRHVVPAAKCARRHADDVFAEELLVHEEIEHARGELPAHRPAFEHEVRMGKRYTLPCRRLVHAGMLAAAFAQFSVLICGVGRAI